MKKIFITGSGRGLGRIYGITGVVTAVLLRVATEPKHRAALPREVEDGDRTGVAALRDDGHEKPDIGISPGPSTGRAGEANESAETIRSSEGP
jgi:hypothetical protein